MWVASCGTDWDGKGCPEELFDENGQSGLVETNQTKKIVYGDGEIDGYIVYDEVSVGNYTANMPFLTNRIPYFSGSQPLPPYSGIVGFAPRDESAGPLIMDYLSGSQISKHYSKSSNFLG